VWVAGDIGLDASEIKSQSYVQITSVSAPKVERKQIKIEAETMEAAAAKLVEALMQEGVL